MSVMRTLVLSSILAALLTAQAAPDTAAVEAAVKVLFDAIHRGDLDAQRQAFSKEAAFYLAAGTKGDPSKPISSRMIGSNKACALYVRHVQMITPDAAYVVALRRCPDAPPPRSSGTLDMTLRRESAGWKVMSWREALLEEVARVKADTPADSGSELLDSDERAEGWKSLFDGKSFRGWSSPSGDEAPASWRVVDGALATVPRSAGVPVRSLRTRQEYTNFDFRFEWMTSEGANSGCIYRLFTVADGMEYQIADDNGDAGARADPRQRSGALYGVTAVQPSVARPVGEWNDARIRVTRERIEHWLNGAKTAEFEVDVPLPSPIVLQYHFTEVKFRNLRIRELP